MKAPLVVRRTIPTWVFVLTVVGGVALVPAAMIARLTVFKFENAVAASDFRPLPEGIPLIMETDECYHGCSRYLAFAAGSNPSDTLDSIAAHYRQLGWPLRQDTFQSTAWVKSSTGTSLTPRLTDHAWSGHDDRGSVTIDLVTVGGQGAMSPGPALPQGTPYVVVGLLRDN